KLLPQNKGTQYSFELELWRVGVPQHAMTARMPLPGAARPSSARKSAHQVILILLLVALAASPLCAREKDALQYGAGLIVNVPMAEDEVAKAVEEVAQNGVIRGTKEYNKDEYVTGAVVAKSSPLFPAWTDGGKIFYK